MIAFSFPNQGIGVETGAGTGHLDSKTAYGSCRGDMERRCREVGVTFQPMIFESFGGVSAEAERVIKCLNKAVAVNTDISEEVVATQFWHRVGVDLVRANCRAFHRRLVSQGGDVLGAVGPLGGSGGLQVAEGL